MKIELAPCKVEFDEFNHTYAYNGKTLSGVTSLLSRQIFKHKYGDISESVLNKAAERGNLIHRNIEMLETFSLQESEIPEVSAYISLRDSIGAKAVATEYLISDYENIASSVDVVFLTGDGLNEPYGLLLCDIKTTSKLDMDYLSWQLSIYDYLFKLNNDKLEIPVDLCAIWLPKEQYGKPKIVKVPFQPTEMVKDLIETDARGEQWINPVAEKVVPTSTYLPIDTNITSAIANYLKAEKQAKEMKERLREIMEQNGITKWDNEDFSATIGAASESATFDSKAFKADNPELYDRYTKTVKKKGSFILKLK